MCDRVARLKSSNRSRSTTVRQSRRAARNRRHTRSTRPINRLSSSGSDSRRRPNAHCEPIDRRRRPTTTARGSRLCASACRCRPAAGPSIATSARSSSSATSATVRMPRLRSLSAVTPPTPHSRCTGSGCRNASSPSVGTISRPSGLATPLATLARNLVRATPTVIARPTRSLTASRSRRAMSAGSPDTRREPAHVEEGLVDGDRFDQRRGVVEDLEHRLAGRRIGLHPGWHHHRLRAQLPGLPAAHRGPHAVRLRLVAGGQHHPGADDHRPAAQPRVVALFHRGVEGVQVGVQYSGLVRHVPVATSPSAEPGSRRSAADR